MSKRITIKDINKHKFYQVPKAFFHNPVYKSMMIEGKMAYTFFSDLLEKSAENGWYNKDGEIYVKLSRKKIMARLNVKGTEKFAKIMKELQDLELIEYVKMGVNNCNEIYILHSDELDNVIYNDDDLIEEEKPKSSKIEPHEVRKSNLMKFENRTHTKTNYIKTNIYISGGSNDDAKQLELLKEMERIFRPKKGPYGIRIQNEFKALCNKLGYEFMEYLLQYCEDRNGGSFAYLKTTIDNLDKKGIRDKESLLLDLELSKKKVEKKKSTPKKATGSTKGKNFISDNEKNGSSMSMMDQYEKLTGAKVTESVETVPGVMDEFLNEFGQ